MVRIWSSQYSEDHREREVEANYLQHCVALSLQDAQPRTVERIKDDVTGTILAAKLTGTDRR